MTNPPPDRKEHENSTPSESPPSPSKGSLAERLREITEIARRKAEQERARREREEQQEAQKIIAAVEQNAVQQAKLGKNHLAVMEVTYTRGPHFAESEGFSLNPSQLTGASRLVYEYCQREGLNPRLVSRWKSIQENIHRIDFCIVIGW